MLSIRHVIDDVKINTHHEVNIGNSPWDSDISWEL